MIDFLKNMACLDSQYASTVGMQRLTEMILLQIYPFNIFSEFVGPIL